MSLHLLKLLALNKGRGQFKINNIGNDEATIYLYDYFVKDDDWGGISDRAFVQALAAITTPVIHLRFNSPGGDVFVGRAIEQAIREHGSKIIAHVDGVAASCATYPVLACDEIVIAPAAFMMIHQSMTYAFGNSNDLKQAAGWLEKIDESLANTYVAKTGQSIEQIQEWINAETWFSAEEAVKYGFADRVAEGSDKSGATNRIDWDLSAYAKAPRANPTPALGNSTDPMPDPEPEPPRIDLSNHYRRLALIEKQLA
jgi:ATP-dependent Clp protease protease subunit